MRHQILISLFLVSALSALYYSIPMNLPQQSNVYKEFSYIKKWWLLSP